MALAYQIVSLLIQSICSKKEIHMPYQEQNSVNVTNSMQIEAQGKFRRKRIFIGSK